jgi:hypothetical protein
MDGGDTLGHDSHVRSQGEQRRSGRPAVDESGPAVNESVRALAFVERVIDEVYRRHGSLLAGPMSPRDRLRLFAAAAFEVGFTAAKRDADAVLAPSLVERVGQELGR